MASQSEPSRPCPPGSWSSGMRWDTTYLGFGDSSGLESQPGRLTPAAAVRRWKRCGRAWGGVVRTQGARRPVVALPVMVQQHACLSVPACVSVGVTYSESGQPCLPEGPGTSIWEGRKPCAGESVFIFSRRLRSGVPKEIHSWCQKTLGSLTLSPSE